MYWLSRLLFRAHYFVKRLVRTVYPIGLAVRRNWCTSGNNLTSNSRLSSWWNSFLRSGRQKGGWANPWRQRKCSFLSQCVPQMAPIYLLTSSKGMYLRRESCSFVKSQGIKLQWTNERVVFICHGRAIILLFQLHKRSAADVSQLQGISWTRRAYDFPFCGCKYQRPITNARLCFFTLQVKWAFSCKFL